MDSPELVLHKHSSDVPSYLSGSLSLLEYYVCYPFNTGIDKKVPWTFSQGQIRLQDKIQSMLCDSAENDYMTKIIPYLEVFQTPSQITVMFFWQADIKEDLWPHTYSKILLHRSLAVI